MKTEQISLSSKGVGIAGALALTEEVGKKAGLDHKAALHLRLLAEEVSGMLRGIAGDVEALYWLETEKKNFELHLRAVVSMTPEMREQFLRASSDGNNVAAGGLMGKIKVMIAGFMLSAKEAVPYAMMSTASSFSAAEGVFWSMNEYRRDLEQNKGKKTEAAEAWDELEKSIVANVADNVTVSIVGKTVEITLSKAF